MEMCQVGWVKRRLEVELGEGKYISVLVMTV